MKLLRAALLAALAFPAAANAAGVALVTREVPVEGRSLLGRAPGRFDLVGLHWQGPGDVRFRTRSLAGRWSRWRPAAPEAEDLPDGAARGGWRVGNPYWTGGSDRIEYRLSGLVTRLRAHFVRSPAERLPLRRLTLAGAPPIILRTAWGADERIRRAGPEYAPLLRVAVVHHTAGTNGYGRAQAAAVVRGIQRFHVLGNGWDDIGYNFLVDRYGQVFEGRFGGIDKNVVGAHAQGFNDGSTGIAVLGSYGTSGISAAARASVAKLIAWRLDVAHVDPLSTLSFLSNGNPRFSQGAPVFLRAVSGHRDTGFTTCPGNALYAQLGSLAEYAAVEGLPKLYDPVARGQVGQLVRFTARLSAPLPWTVTITDPAGQPVAMGSGEGELVDWTWDATLTPPGRYSYSIATPDALPATGPVGPRLARLRILRLSAAPATLQAGRAIVRYRLTAPAAVTAKLVDAAGAEVATLFTAQKRAGDQSFTLAAAGLAEGRYRVALAAAASDGQQASAGLAVGVDRTLASFSLDRPVYSPRQGPLTFAFEIAARPLRATLRIRRDGTTVATIANGTYAPGAQSVAWDGRTRSGRAAPAGSYRAVLSGTSSIATVTRTLAFRVR